MQIKYCATTSKPVNKMQRPSSVTGLHYSSEEMEKHKEKRRTIGGAPSSVSKTLPSPRSSNSISSFFFGQPKASLSSSSVSPKHSSSAKHHSSQKALGLVEAGKARMGILRQNSNASVSSAASRATASSKGSVRDSPMTAPLSVRVLSSNDEQDRVESKAMAVSMKLGMWEGGSVAGDSSSRAGTPTHRSGSGKSQGKRSLNRDNSVGSTFSNVSNISNNSNISILSHSSNGSHKSSFKDGSGPAGSSSASVTGSSAASAFSPAAAAAASRQRYLSTAVQQGPYVLSSVSSQSMEESKDPGPNPQQSAQRRDDSLRSTASMELMAASSSENSPVSTPRRDSPDDAKVAEPQPHQRGAGDARMECDEKNSAPGAAVTRPTLLSAARDVVVVQSALKKLRRSMSPLPNTREGVERARSSWVQSAADKTGQQARPRMVKFTSSTKSMGELRSKEEQQKQGHGEGAEDAASCEKEGAPGIQEALQEDTQEDIFVLEGVPMVEESEEEMPEQVSEHVAEQATQVAQADQDGAPEVAASPSAVDAEAENALRSAETEAPVQGQSAPSTTATQPAEIRIGSAECGNTAIVAAAPVPAASHVTAPPAALVQKRSDGMMTIPLPKLTHVEPEPHPVTPVKAEFLAVKLKSTPSMTPAVVTPPATPTSAAQEQPAGSAKKAASLQDPRVPLAELVRINAQKAYGDLVSTELEVYLDDAEFARTFRVTRQVFYEMPLWRQHNQKRSVGLF